MGRRDGTSAGAVLRAGSSSRSAAWQLMTWFAGVTRIPRPSMRAIAPEREWDGRRWGRGRISTRRAAFGTGAMCSSGNEKWGGWPDAASRVQSAREHRAVWEGGEAWLLPGDLLERFRSPRPGRGRVIPAIYIDCVYRASCHRSEGALWWGPQMDHRSRARQSLYATSSCSPCLDRD